MNAIGDKKSKDYAFSKGKEIAKLWFSSASHQEKKDVMHRSNLIYDTNYFMFMRNFFFRSIQRILPIEALQFAGKHKDSFMMGWREEVIELLETTGENCN